MSNVSPLYFSKNPFCPICEGSLNLSGKGDQRVLCPSGPYHVRRLSEDPHNPSLLHLVHERCVSQISPSVCPVQNCGQSITHFASPRDLYRAWNVRMNTLKAQARMDTWLSDQAYIRTIQEIMLALIDQNDTPNLQRAWTLLQNKMGGEIPKSIRDAYSDYATKGRHALSLSL